MRGRSIDINFVQKFIKECIAVEKNTQEDICKEAIAKIKEIDSLVKTRGKLVDVLNHFSYKEKLSNNLSFKSISLSNFYDIEYFFNKGNTINLNDLIEHFNKFDYSYKQNLVLLVKQLLENKIIKKDNNNFLSKGYNWDIFVQSSKNEKGFQ